MEVKAVGVSRLHVSDKPAGEMLSLDRRGVRFRLMEDGTMKRLLGIACVCAFWATWTSPARAAPTTIAFETLPETAFNSYTEGPVTFRGVNNEPLMRDYSPNGTLGLRSVVSPFQEMRADIVGGASSISVDLGDYPGVDSETVFLEGYNASGNLVTSASQFVDINYDDMTTLSISGGCFAYAIFGSFGSTSNNGSSVRADNFTYELCACPSVIPAPGAILLASMGAGLVGHLRRRKTL